MTLNEALDHSYSTFSELSLWVVSDLSGKYIITGFVEKLHKDRVMINGQWIDRKSIIGIASKLTFSSFKIAYKIFEYNQMHNDCPIISKIMEITRSKSRPTIYRNLYRLREHGLIEWKSGQGVMVIKPEIVKAEYEAAVKRKQKEYVY